MGKRGRPRVFVDADVIFAGSASPSEHSASLVTLRMGEITLVDAVTSRQAITEVERNLAEKISGALTTFRLLVELYASCRTQRGRIWWSTEISPIVRICLSSWRQCESAASGR
jgi:hypothetical protein